MRGDGWRRGCCLVLGGNIPSGLTVFLSSGCWFLGASTHGVSQVSGWWSFMVSPVLQGVVVTKQFKRSLSISTGAGGEKGSQASTLPQQLGRYLLGAHFPRQDFSVLPPKSESS